MTYKKQFLLATSVALASIFTSCEPKKNETLAPISYSEGVFIVNEGPFGSGTGTVSFFKRDSKTLVNDIYGLANNNLPIGNIVQSINVIGDKAYIVANNSNKVEVTNLSDFKSTGTISGLNQPRYLIQVSSSKAYVSQWVNGYKGEVKVVNLATNNITKTINTGVGAEKILVKGNYAYVTCSGGYVTDSVLTIIDIAKDSVIKTLVVGLKPRGIVEDVNGFIWVLSQGIASPWPAKTADRSASLVKINPTTNTIEQTINFNDLSSTASNLTINKDKNKLFFNFNGAIVSQNITSSTFDKTVVVNKDFYGLGIDPTTDIIYGADAGDYSSAGKVIRYNISGAVIDTLKVGIAPNGFFFK